MNKRNCRNVLLLVLAKILVCVHTQGHTYYSIEAAVSDATREVNTRRSGELLRQVQQAAAGKTSQSTDNIPKCSRHHSQRHAPELDKAISYAGDIAITATAKYAERNEGAIPDPTEFRKLMKPYCPNRATACNRNDLYRTANGSCNNLHNPSWGASLTTQARLMPPSYGDKFNLGLLPRMQSVTDCPLPSPRTISNALFSAGTSPPRSKRFSLVLTHFGQFLDHDFISTPPLTDGGNAIACCNGSIPVNRPECASFRTPPGEFLTTCMAFVRSEFGVDPDCCPGPRNQLNQRTSFIDLSTTYGDTLTQQNDLRETGTGRLSEGLNRILPNGPSGPTCVTGDVCFKSGDGRSAEVPMISVIHIIFLREHNNIVERLRSLGWTDGDLLYQEAKKILTGIYQHIVYSEYLPIILGDEGMSMFGLWSTPTGFNTQYNPSVNPTIRNACAAAAFRFGHSEVGSFVESFNEDFTPLAKIPMEDTFLNTRSIRNFDERFGPDAIARWMTTQFQSKSDRFFSPSVRNRLFQSMPKNGFDLPALNIQRGRDHGIPAYNRWREFCGFHPAQHFGTKHFGLTDHDSSAAKALKSIYKHPDDIDLFAGGISEKRSPGALVGPTFRCLIGLQFSLFKTGDRFFYENNFFPTGFTTDQLQQIKKQSLSALYCRTMAVNSMPKNAFESPLAE
ncbi:peroxidase-like protein [Mytilus trossulus]|uniref:peroxidase-like protein n=1 Tax=Mytilus trossulus TaxID=6551 RepID=UPI00300771C9